jgi:hypothetical protein
VLVSAYETDRSGGLNKAARTLSFCSAYAGLDVKGLRNFREIDRQDPAWADRIERDFCTYRITGTTRYISARPGVE